MIKTVKKETSYFLKHPEWGARQHQWLVAITFVNKSHSSEANNTFLQNQYYHKEFNFPYGKALYTTQTNSPDKYL